MATTLSKDAKRISSIVDEIADYHHTISLLEYQICDVPREDLEEDKDDLEDEQKRLQNRVNIMSNDLKFDDNVEIVYDGKLTQVFRDGDLWLECYSGQGGYGWVEHDPSEVRRNQRVAFLKGFAWDRMSDQFLDGQMQFLREYGFDAVK